MKIRFLDVGCGDCIHIFFTDREGQKRNILIDGGTEEGDVYDRTLKRIITSIVEQGDHIDLWIITHIDDDHIGGILRLLKDETLFDKVDFSRIQFWYNYSNWDYDTGIRPNDLKSVGQAMRLRDFLLENSRVNEMITDQTQVVDFFGARFTILSPNHQSFSRLMAKWKMEETKIRQKDSSSLKMAKKNDYSIKMEDFDVNQYRSDGSVENASSIAFLLEYNDERILMTGDSHPNKVATRILDLWNGEKLPLQYMQIPHHGSKSNTSKKLLQSVECDHFIISGDAYNRNNLPNKETMVKYIKAFPDRDITFHITAKNLLTENIFKVDKPQRVNLEFPKGNDYYLEFDLGCKI